MTGLAGVASTASTAQAVPSRVHAAAEQFEAMLLQQLVKPLSEAMGAEESEEGKTGDAGPLQSYAGEALANALAHSGALGFARQIEAELQRSSAKKMSQNSSSSAEAGR